jgi:hypothetical protein
MDLIAREYIDALSDHWESRKVLPSWTQPNVLVGIADKFQAINRRYGVWQASLEQFEFPALRAFRSRAVVGAALACMCIDSARAYALVERSKQRCDRGEIRRVDVRGRSV